MLWLLTFRLSVLEEGTSVNCDKFLSSDIDEYKYCEKNEITTDSPVKFGSVTDKPNVVIIGCSFANYQCADTSAKCGVFQMSYGTLFLNTSTFTLCTAPGTSCVYVDSSVTATLENSKFHQCDSSRYGPLVVFPADHFANGDISGCIGGSGNLVFTNVEFIGNQDGALVHYRSGTYYETTLNVTSCTFKDNYPTELPVADIRKGGDIVIGKNSVSVIENWMFDSTFTRDRTIGHSVRIFGKDVSFTNCYFTTKSMEGSTVWLERYNTAGASSIYDMQLTFTRCSFDGPCIHLTKSMETGDYLSVNVTVYECLSFSGENAAAVVKDIQLPGENVLYSGAPCFWWPSNEEDAEPTTEDDIPTTIEDDADMPTSPTNPEDVVPGDGTTEEKDVIDETPEGNKNPDDTGLTGGEIAAIVVVPVAVIAGAVVLLVFFLWRRKKEKSSLSPDSAIENEQESMISTHE